MIPGLGADALANHQPDLRVTRLAKFSGPRNAFRCQLGGLFARSITSHHRERWHFDGGILSEDFLHPLSGCSTPLHWALDGTALDGTARP